MTWDGREHAPRLSLPPTARRFSVVPTECRRERIHSDNTGGSASNSYSNRYISVLTLREGEVAHWRDYLDPVAVFDAVGWPPR
jgi:ketosteroid isomerase-like protein